MSSAYLRVQRWRALNKTEKVSNKNINNSVDNEQSFNNESVNISCVSEVNDISVTDSCNLQAFNSHNLDNDNNYDFICTSDNDSDSSEYSSSKIKGSDCSENNNDEQLPGDAVHSFSPHNSEKVMQKTLSEKLRCWTLDNLNILKYQKSNGKIGVITAVSNFLSGAKDREGGRAQRNKYK
ncbi:hypothetical protein WA026_004941 [Henosepilachna vigintioctopunctata]|uniref:Uncharacterized protein n=1 Tax=Henosepilachna vigintioctopunctata TaxID=420089 RepID=A0AAW1UK60_9CUCU